MNTFFNNLGLILTALVLSWFTGPWFGKLYERLFDISLDGGWFGGTDSWQLITGFPLALVFFFTFLLIAFGLSKNRFIYLGLLLAPLLIFQFFVDQEHLLFPIVLAILAFIAAWVVRKLLNKYLPGTFLVQ